MESGAAVFAMTYSDMQTAADKCEEMEEGYTQCSQFLYGMWQFVLRGLVTALICPVSPGYNSISIFLLGRTFVCCAQPWACGQGQPS